MRDQTAEDEESLPDVMKGSYIGEGSSEWKALHPRMLSKHDLYFLKRWQSKPLSRKPPTNTVVVSASTQPFAALGIGSGPGAVLPSSLVQESGTYVDLLAHKSTSRDAVGAMYERLQQALKKDREVADKIRTGIWYEGWLHKAPGAACINRSWPRRYAVLSIFALSLYKEKPSGATHPHGQYISESPLEYVDLLNVLGKATTFESETKEHCFQMPMPAGKVRVFHVADEDSNGGREPAGWIEAVNAAVAHLHTLPAGSRPSTYAENPAYFTKRGGGGILGQGTVIEALVIGHRNGF